MASKRCFRLFFASIPHQWTTRNPIEQYEGFYASVFYKVKALNPSLSKRHPKLHTQRHPKLPPNVTRTSSPQIQRHPGRPIRCG